MNFSRASNKISFKAPFVQLLMYIFHGRDRKLIALFKSGVSKAMYEVGQ